MFAVERQNKIKEALLKHKRVNVSALATMLNVSEATIRKDLDVLESQGVLRKMYGGAVFNEEYSSPEAVGFGASLKLEDPLIEEKMDVARTASQLIDANDTIFIGNGVTCACLADAILENRDIDYLKVVTNNLYVLLRLSNSDHISVISTGGQLKKGSGNIPFFGGITSSISPSLLSSLHYKKCFFTVDAVSLTHGYMVDSPEALDTINIVRSNSQLSYALVDSSKFDMVSMLQLTPFTEVSKIVTNKEVPDNYKSFCFENNIQIFIPFSL